ncbi:hypothetical protein [Rhizobium ruizarguesonis]|uniref:hypothetical protein n=1 Tax=Rhizobium ruizarguesonis TaxID=2081791 RepID=UPI00102FE2CB|nr:hypothetical protein [Rhizobium ruizarguesonis]TAV04515.1 hypothetical protein ELI39_04020 [Rhizobium ruizarguesonis]
MKLLCYSLASLLAAGSVSAATPKTKPAACSYKIGDRAIFMDPAEYLAVAKSNREALGGDKGEFETTQDYNRRTDAAQKALAIKPVLLAHPANYDEPDSGVTYIADEQRFRIFVGSFIGTLDGIDYRYMDKVVLQQTLTNKDTYVAANAYGSQTSVERSDWDVISIKSWNTSPKSIYWKLDSTADGEGYSVSIPVPLDQARTFKSGLRAGIEFLPKMPFMSTDTDHVRPTADWPKEMTYHHQVFDGVVLCAVLADKNGKVVKTVQPIVR